MPPKKILILINIFIVSICFSQNMKQGYNYLETGKYNQAEVFFKETLKTYPKNKTANLCYGRAIGLNGKTKDALKLFFNLLNDYPNDFEIKLNYAEALLWNKDFITAETYYENLLKENNTNFSALLGYANTLSSLKKYDKALIYIEKALDISPKNPNALISRKYIKLGLANSYTNIQNYNEAENILKENLQDFKDDTETLLNLANLYLISEAYDKAEETYTKLRLKNENISLNGVSLVYHLKNNDKLALLTSEKSLSLLNENTDKKIIDQTKERYIQALIWNKKYKIAENEIQKLFDTTEIPENWMLGLRASLNIYKSDFNKSLQDYDLILANDSTSFDGNLGKANVLKALEKYDSAYKNANTTLKYYYNQKDALRFIKDLDKIFTPFVEVKTSYSFDGDNNDAFMYYINSEFAFSTRLKLLGSYNHRFTKNPVANLEAKSNNFLVGVSYQILNNITLESSLGLNSSKADTNNFNHFLADISLFVKPGKLQNLELDYKREIQNFNAELINREIVLNNFIANYNLSTNFKLGWFTQYYYTSQSDSNIRNLLFTSLYYNILEKPILKVGFNYQYMAFKNQVPTIYFSPSNFNAYEVFVNLLKDENSIKNKEWFYDLTAAFGFQNIEDNSTQSTYRIEGKFGYKLSDRSLFNIYGTQSNIASTTAAGFTFTEIGLRFKWLFLEKPYFRNK